MKTATTLILIICVSPAYAGNHDAGFVRAFPSGVVTGEETAYGSSTTPDFIFSFNTDTDEFTPIVDMAAETITYPTVTISHTIRDIINMNGGFVLNEILPATGTEASIDFDPVSWDVVTTFGFGTIHPSKVARIPTSTTIPEININGVMTFWSPAHNPIVTIDVPFSAVIESTVQLSDTVAINILPGSAHLPFGVMDVVTPTNLTASPINILGYTWTIEGANVQHTAFKPFQEVPEPSSFALLAFGMMAFIRMCMLRKS